MDRLIPPDLDMTVSWPTDGQWTVLNSVDRVACQLRTATHSCSWNSDFCISDMYIIKCVWCSFQSSSGAEWSDSWKPLKGSVRNRYIVTNYLFLACIAYIVSAAVPFTGAEYPDSWRQLHSSNWKTVSVKLGLLTHRMAYLAPPFSPIPVRWSL